VRFTAGWEENLTKNVDAYVKKWQKNIKNKRWERWQQAETPRPM